MTFKDLILLENSNYIIINKPTGISSLQERFGMHVSIQDLSKSYLPIAQLGHRLDKMTSGVLVVAKNPEAYRNFHLQLQNREVIKKYHAIVHGTHKFDRDPIDLPIKVSSSGKAKIDFKMGKQSLTIIKSIENFRHFTLLECLPITGRLHQIRIHLANQGANLVSDTSYGGKFPFLSQIKKNYKRSTKEKEPIPMISRFALHAYSISFSNIDGEELIVNAPYPKDFVVFLKQLRKYDQI